MGHKLLGNLKNILTGSQIREVRGKGLFIGAEFTSDKYAYALSKKMLENGLIAKPTQKNIIRFAPPLCINSQQIE